MIHAQPRNGGGVGLKAAGVLAQSAVAASVTGTTSETTLATIAIPAGAMGVNGSLRIRPKFSYTGNTNLKTMRVRLGGTSFWFADNGANASNIGSQPLIDIENRGAANSQIGVAGGTAGVNLTITTAHLTGVVDTTAAQNLTITAQLANGADTATLEAYTVEILNP